MQAPEDIMNVWNQFKHFPMETFTKVWYAKQNPLKYQRSVVLMKEHYEQYKITGNCFDLALWLLDEFKQYNIRAYAIGRDLFTKHAHIAVIALDDSNHKYFCDLGDQWIQPIFIDNNSDDCVGFFPGATIQVLPSDEHIEILYKRPNGKVSKQRFNLDAIDEQTLWEAAEFSQRLVKPRPLLECRIYEEKEVLHWEFYNWKSFSSSMKGLVEDEDLSGKTEWAKRIHKRTGYSYEILLEVLTYYQNVSQ